ncbi:MAG: hypothetical protein ACFBSF_13005 [Leptolyngbyaceae cyanobacterium]
MGCKRSQNAAVELTFIGEKGPKQLTAGQVFTRAAANRWGFMDDY